MQAGKELDVLIAEKVMGLRRCKRTQTGSISAIMVMYECECGKIGECFDPDIPGPSLYSTDIAAAWEIVEKFKGMLHRGGRVWIQVYAEPTAKEYKEIGEIDHGLSEWCCVMGN